MIEGKDFYANNIDIFDLRHVWILTMSRIGGDKKLPLVSMHNMKETLSPSI